jgi:hypothetical protein
MTKNKMREEKKRGRFSLSQLQSRQRIRLMVRRESSQFPFHSLLSFFDVFLRLVFSSLSSNKRHQDCVCCSSSFEQYYLPSVVVARKDVNMLDIKHFKCEREETHFSNATSQVCANRMKTIQTAVTHKDRWNPVPLISFVPRFIVLDLFPFRSTRDGFAHGTTSDVALCRSRSAIGSPSFFSVWTLSR